MTETSQHPYGLGRRKEAVACVRLMKGTGTVTINKKPLVVYFPAIQYQKSVLAPLQETGMLEQFDVIATARGGGLTGQASAVRLGIARALVELQPDLRPMLKKQGMMKRDARIKERKKYGLKKARRSPQWAKR